jgi:hypothetical protein
MIEIFSHGVLEHFKDEQIKYIIRRQKQEAQRVIHYVPTNKYVKQSFGDERLMSAKEWIKRFSPTNFKTFNSGFDLILEF